MGSTSSYLVDSGTTIRGAEVQGWRKQLAGGTELDSCCFSGDWCCWCVGGLGSSGFELRGMSTAYKSVVVLDVCIYLPPDKIGLGRISPSLSLSLS
jgi:hypothetical protein